MRDDAALRPRGTCLCSSRRASWRNCIEGLRREPALSDRFMTVLLVMTVRISSWLVEREPANLFGLFMVAAVDDGPGGLQSGGADTWGEASTATTRTSELWRRGQGRKALARARGPRVVQA